MKNSNSDSAAQDRANALLEKLNTAVRAVNNAQTELVSRSKEVGLLLLEAKKLHPAVKDFEAFLKRVDGLKLSRAYDLLRLAGGRTTDEELRKEARERKQKSREQKKLAKVKELSKPISVTDPHVTESAEISIEQRRAENAALDDSAEEYFSPEEITSDRNLNEFKIACRKYLPAMVMDDQIDAQIFVNDMLMDLWAAKKAKAA